MDRLKRLEDVSLFLCAQMGTEEEIEWVRGGGGEGREEVGENGSGRQKDESGQERRKESGEDVETSREKEWEERSRDAVTALMCLPE